MKKYNCTCDICGEDFYRKLTEIKKSKRHFCSLLCRNKAFLGSGNPFYGKKHTEDVKVVLSRKRFKCGYSLTEGYIRLYEKGNRGQLLHRFVMENFIKRPLKIGEIVHHINRDRADNRIENLKIMDRASHMSLHRRLNETSQEKEEK